METQGGVFVAWRVLHLGKTFLPVLQIIIAEKCQALRLFCFQLWYEHLRSDKYLLYIPSMKAVTS